MDVTKHYEFIGFGAMEVSKPHKFMGFGAIDIDRNSWTLGGPRYVLHEDASVLALSKLPPQRDNEKPPIPILRGF